MATSPTASFVEYAGAYWVISEDVRPMKAHLEPLSNSTFFLGVLLIQDKSIVKITLDLTQLKAKDPNSLDLKLWAWGANEPERFTAGRGRDWEAMKPPSSVEVWSLREQARKRVFADAPNVNITADISRYISGNETEFFKTGEQLKRLPKGSWTLALMAMVREGPRSSIVGYAEWPMQNVDDVREYEQKFFVTPLVLLAIGGALAYARPFRNRADALLPISFLPVVFLFVLDPNSFFRGWSGFGQLGRGGLLFLAFFLIMDWMDSRSNFRIRLRRPRMAIASLACLAAILVLYGALSMPTQIYTGLLAFGYSLGVSYPTWPSWLLAWEQLAFTGYIVALVAACLGVVAVRRLPIPLVYTVGMTVIFLLDAFFPYGTLGPLQAWVNLVVPVVTFLLTLTGVNAEGHSNILRIEGDRGLFVLQIYWPSAGVHSMIIYSIVLIVLMLKLEAPIGRKAIYASAGALGTAFMNIFRITLIGLYADWYAGSIRDLEAFHDVIGEILFLVWIIIFVSIVVKTEMMLGRRSGQPRPAHPDRD